MLKVLLRAEKDHQRVREFASLTRLIIGKRYEDRVVKIKIFALFRPLTSPPLTSDLCQEPGREASERRTDLLALERRTVLLLFPRTGPRSWTKDEGRFFRLSRAHTPSAGACCHPALERGFKIKSGRAAFRCLLGGRWTVNGGRLSMLF